MATGSNAPRIAGIAMRANFRHRLSGGQRVSTRSFIAALLFAANFLATAEAEPAKGAADAPAAATERPRNIYGEQLKPQIKRPRAAPAAPYAPIQAQDDKADVPEIQMFVGESRVFPTPGVARIAVGNGQIMTAAALDDKETIVFANGAGTSSLFVWNADGGYQRIKVNILAGDTSRIAREIAAFLKAVPNAQTAIVGDKVIVEGDNLSDSDLAKIEELGKRYPQLVNFTNRVGWEQMVMLDVYVVEFPVTQLRELGLRWNSVGGATIGAIWLPIRRGNAGPYDVNIPSGQNTAPPITNPNGGGPVLPSSLNILGALNLGISAQLNLLEQEGKAAILAQPQLSTRSGGKASFLAGGEFPISISTINGVTIIYKQFGVKLDIEPRVDRNGVIRAKVGTEVSAIDPSIVTTGGPALRTRKTSTEFNVHSGETIVLSGLIQRDMGTNIDKVPFLGDIPVLGALFRSKRYQNTETELVVFVTPNVIDAHSPAVVDRLQRTNERLQQNLGPPPYLNTPSQPKYEPPASNGSPAPEPNSLGATQPSPTNEVTQPARDGGTACTSPQHCDSFFRTEAAGVRSDAAERAPTQRSANAAEPPKKQYRVSYDQLALRAQPDMSAPVLKRLKEGETVVALPRPERKYWRAVQSGDKQGWAAALWLDPIGTN